MGKNDHIGVSSSDMDIVRSVFGVVHGVGKGLLSSFGMGGLAQGLEKVEMQAGLLHNPDAAPVPAQVPEAQAETPSAAPPVPPPAPVVSANIVVAKPDAAVLIQNLPGGRRARGLRGVRQVAVQGGVRFTGNGYRKGDPIGQTFSFGVDKPARVEVIDNKGRRSLVSVRQILFLGGTESASIIGNTQVQDGESMGKYDEIDLIESQVLGGPQDYTQMSAYKNAAASLAAAQARHVEAMARLQRAKTPSTFMPTLVSIPSFTFSPTSFSTSPATLPPVADLATATVSTDSVTSPVSTDPNSVPPGAGASSMMTPDGKQIDWGDATRPGDWTPSMGYPQGVVGSQPGWLEINEALGQDDSLGEEVLGELDAIVHGESVIGHRRHKNLCPVVRCPQCSTELCVVQADRHDAGGSVVAGALASLAQVCRGERGGVPRALTKTGSKFAGACPNCGVQLDLTLGSSAPSATIASPPVSMYEHGSAVVGASYYVGVAATAKPAAPAGGKLPIKSAAAPAGGKLPIKSAAAPAGGKLPIKSAAAPAGGKPAAKAKPERVKVRAATRSKAKSPHLAAIKRTENVIKYAMSRAKKVEKKADAYKPKDHKTIIPVKLGDVKGKTILGSDKVMSPKQQAAVQKHTNALVTHQKASVATRVAAKKARAAAVQAKDAIKKAKPQIAKLSKKGALRNIILGVDEGYEEVLGDDLLLIGDEGYEEVVGAPGWDEVVGAPGWDEVVGAPGWDEVVGAVSPLPAPIGTPAKLPTAASSTSAPDMPNAEDQEIADLLNILDYIDDLVGEDMAPPTDPAAGVPTDDSFESDMFDDAGDIPLPTRGEPLSADAAKTVYWTKSDLPEDAVFYQGDRGVVDNALGSWNTFYGRNPNAEGFSDGWLNGKRTAKENQSARDIALSVFTGGLSGAIQASINAAKDAQTQQVQWVYRAPETYAPEAFHTPPEEFVNNVKKIAKNSIDRGWGPLIGNPRGDLAGLQFCMETGDFFWQGNHAPVWATAVADAKITELNKKTAAAKQAAAEADAAARAQEQAAQAEAQAKQDAANALAQSAADTQANIARQALEAQQGQQALQQQQQQAATDAAKAQAAIVQQQQQTAADVAAAKHQQELAALQAKSEAELFATYQRQDAAQQQIDMESQRAMLEWAKTQGEMPAGGGYAEGGYAEGGEGGYAEGGYAEEGGYGGGYGGGADGGLNDTGSDRGREDRSE